MGKIVFQDVVSRHTYMTLGISSTFENSVHTTGPLVPE